jgi:hypothetical protein
MRNIMRNFISGLSVAFILVIIVSACKKDTSPVQVAVALATNSAPNLSFAFDTFNYFVSVQVITSENYNETQFSCVGTKKTLTIPNTNGSGHQFTVGCANAFIGSPLYSEANVFNSNVYCNSYRLHVFGGCVLPFPTPLATGYSDTIAIGPISNWTSYNPGNSDSVWNFADNTILPSIADIVSGDSVFTKASYTLSALGNVTGDSVIFVITGPLASVSHVLGPNASSCTFTGVEMASLGTTGSNKSGLLQIAPYKFHVQNISGAQCYFAKETCLSKYVILQ